MLPPEDRRVLVVLNPAADADRPGALGPRFREALEERGVAVDVGRTEGPGHERKLAAAAADEGYSHVAAVGGDGTVSGCASALAGRDPALVVVPAGRGNDFARAVGAPSAAEEAAEAAARGGAREVDVGRIVGPRGSGPAPGPEPGSGELVFANGLGLGLDGAVAHRVAARRGVSGRLGYTAAAVREAASFDPFHLRVEADGAAEEGPTLLAGASNGPAHGGGFHVAPGAQVDDGALDVYRFGAVGVATRLRMLPRVKAGKHGDLDVFGQSLAREVTFAVDEPVPAHADGEVFTLEPGTHEVAVEPGALSVATAPP